MKAKYNELTSTIGLVVVFLFLISCKGGSGQKDPEISQDEKINGVWTLYSVDVDGTDVTNNFSGFTITFNSSGPNSYSGNYVIGGGYSLLDPSGNYSLIGTTAMSIKQGLRGGIIEAQISLSDSDKTLTFSFYNPSTTFGGGKTSGVQGQYTFVLKKQ